MAAPSAAPTFDVQLAAGEVERRDVIAVAQLPAEIVASLHAAADDGAQVRLRDEEGADIPAQVDEAGRLTWLAAGVLPAGMSRTYRGAIVPGDLPPRAPAAAPVEVRVQADRVAFLQGGRLLTRYVYLGVWKPYFWPIMTPAGNVVRGASGEHQHQTGLFFAYGGHGGPTTSNVWSDWDEPPYGPDGKELHTAWEIVHGGPVYGRLVQRLTYTTSSGGHLLDERREVRLYPLPDGSLVFDVAEQPTPPEEAGPSPFILAARIADPLRLVNLNRRDAQGRPLALDPPGVLTAERDLELENPANASYRTAGRWLDWSGRLAGGVAGLAFFTLDDHAPDERVLTAGGYGCCSLRTLYPRAVPAGGVNIRRRVVAHAGDAAAAQIAARFRDYAQPPLATIG